MVLCQERPYILFSHWPSLGEICECLQEFCLSNAFACARELYRSKDRNSRPVIFVYSASPANKCFPKSRPIGFESSEHFLSNPANIATTVDSSFYSNINDIRGKYIGFRPPPDGDPVALTSPGS